MHAYRVSTDSKEDNKRHDIYEKQKLEDFAIARKLAERFVTPTSQEQEEYKNFYKEELERQERVKNISKHRATVEKKWKKEKEKQMKENLKKEKQKKQQEIMQQKKMYDQVKDFYRN